MTKKTAPAALGALEAVNRDAKDPQYTLRLYVAGLTNRSQEAIRTVTSICEEQLAGRYDLEVIDIYQHPELANSEQIIAAPTLIKKRHSPCVKSSAAWQTRTRFWLAWT